MREGELFEFLKNQRITGNESYFSVKDIEAYVKRKGGNGLYNVRKQLKKLHYFGYLEMEIDSESKFLKWKKLYRVRKQVLKRSFGGFLIGN